MTAKQAIQALIVAVPETAGSALYGMVDVLGAAGQVWQTLVREETGITLFKVSIVSPLNVPFTCGHNIPVTPACCIEQDPEADILILPELWLGPDDSLKGRYPDLMDWIRTKYRAGVFVYSACSGAVMLAESGLLNGCPATSHWGYEDLFKSQYPAVHFNPAPNLVFADQSGRIVTAGGTTSWNDLAMHIIARHASPGEALRIAKVYLLKWHGEGDTPYASLLRDSPHADSIVRRCQTWLQEHYRRHDAIQQVVENTGIPERTMKRRFKAATGTTLIDYLQNLRVEAAKRQLEMTSIAIDEISAEVGYEDRSFFRRLFKRRTGLKPSEYRRLFQPLVNAGGEPKGTR